MTGNKEFKEFKEFKIKTTVVQTYVHEQTVLAESEEAAKKGEVFNRNSGEGISFVNGSHCGVWQEVRVDGVKYGGLKNVKQQVEISEVAE